MRDDEIGPYQGFGILLEEATNPGDFSIGKRAGFNPFRFRPLVPKRSKKWSVVKRDLGVKV